MSRRDFGPPPTLLQLHKSTCWVWLVCHGCFRLRPVTIAPFMIRWGMHASSDRLRQSARCARCGKKGAALQTPSWTGSQTGFLTYAEALGRSGDTRRSND